MPIGWDDPDGRGFGFLKSPITHIILAKDEVVEGCSAKGDDAKRHELVAVLEPSCFVDKEWLI